MYIAMLIGLMLVFPITSIALESLLRSPVVVDAAPVGRWFVFWALGVRLLIAGLRQIVQPRFTAETILGIRHADAQLIVRELGFANVAIGIAGLVSIVLPAWISPLAVIGAIFYGCAGINHTMHERRNGLENAAMLSDLFAAMVLLIVCFATKSS